MSMMVPEYGSEKSGIVIVDSEKFLQLWRNEPRSLHSAEAHGTPQTWLNHEKYSDASNGFSHGEDDPVSLASAEYGIETREKRELQEPIHYVNLTDGVTRTIWLLSNGCQAFPIKCVMPGAREFHRTAAALGTPFYTIDELAKAAGSVSIQL